MAQAQDGFWMENAAAGQRSRLVELPGETGGRRFVLEYIDEPWRGETAVPAHLHTTYTETFEILAGRAKYRLGDREGVAQAGDRVVMPPLVTHVHPWSASNEALHVRQITTADPPDLEGMIASIQGAITIQGLAKAGRVNAKGIPNLLQVAVIIDAAMPATYIAGPPIWLQRAAFGVLSRVGQVVGYRTAYPQYGLLAVDGLTLPH
jgi:mannose-6-phosphate isomerase-like protein (cupin superfamily)